MKLVRFTYRSFAHWGILEDAAVRLLSRAPYQRIRPTSTVIKLSSLRLLAPAEPAKIVLVGLNYADHARELNMSLPKEPIVFLKPPSALIAHKAYIVYPSMVRRLDYEAELGLVIKKEAKNVSVKNAPKYILGYSCLNDVTARDLQKKDGQWTRAKSFDTFCPFGPHLETELRTADVAVRSYLNGSLKQDSSTRQFIFSPPELVSFISRIMTLSPGDIISTGTPSGIGPMRPADVVSVEIQGIGILTNTVARGH